MFEVELVGKIGSMALIDRAHNQIDYNKFARIGKSLRPGMIWVSSGATEIGRLDYISRNGVGLVGDKDDVKTDYASQGQAILMQTYRNFINSNYSVRQVLVEHTHFNNEAKRAHIKNLLLRAVAQNAIPIINYNDCVSAEETRKMEIREIQHIKGTAVELVDNDETASQIACLVHAKTLLILTNLDGIYGDIKKESSLIRRIGGSNIDELISNIDKCKDFCRGASRDGANGAGAKLEYIKPCVEHGTTVIIASSKYDISEVMAGYKNSDFPCTVIGLDD